MIKVDFKLIGIATSKGRIWLTKLAATPISKIQNVIFKIVS
jgi:hypothetical protein